MDRGCVEDKVPNMFPEVKGVVCSARSIDTDERHQYYYPIIMRYLKNKILGWNVGDFLYEQGVHNFALYAITEITRVVIMDLEKCNKPVKLNVICDKNYKKYSEGFFQHEVISITDLIDLYKMKKIDKIIICSIFYMNEIFGELMNGGVELEDVISINSAIFNESVKKC